MNSTEVILKKSKHLLTQYFSAIKNLVDKKKRLRQCTAVYKSLEGGKLEKRTMKIWINKIKRQNYYEEVFFWTLLEVRKAILKNYFKDLKQYSKYKQLKRMAPQLYEKTIIQKAFYRIYKIKQRKTVC